MSSIAPMTRSSHRMVNYPAAGGLVLRGEAWGTQNAPPVLLLHDCGQTRHMWRNIAHTLAELGSYAVTIDLRGHGDSNWALNGDYSLNTFVADIQGVATSFSQQPALVGIGLGGIIALLAEGEMLSPISSAVVLAGLTPHLEAEEAEWFVPLIQAHLEEFMSLVGIKKADFRYWPTQPYPQDFSTFVKDHSEALAGWHRWQQDPQLFCALRRERAWNRERLLAAVRALQVPTLLFRDSLIDPASQDPLGELVAAIPHAQYADLSVAEQLRDGDDAGTLSRAIAGFLYGDVD